MTTSIYFYQVKEKKIQPPPIQNDDCVSKIEVAKENSVCREVETLVEFSWSNAKDLFISHVSSAYTKKVVIFWSCWWILLHTGFLMCYMFNQALWAAIEPDRKVMYNGFAEAGLTSLGAFGSMMAAKLSHPFIEKWAMGIVIICSMAMGSFSIMAGLTPSVFVSYAMYILIGGTYYFMITVAK